MLTSTYLLMVTFLDTVGMLKKILDETFCFRMKILIFRVQKGGGYQPQVELSMRYYITLCEHFTGQPQDITVLLIRIRSQHPDPKSRIPNNQG